MFTILNLYSDYPFKKTVKQQDSLKVALGKLECFKDIDFFCWYLLSKMQDKTILPFKVVKIGVGLLVPV